MAETKTENERLRTEIGTMKAIIDKLQEPHGYWDTSNTDTSHDSIEEITEEYDPGDIVEVRPFRELDTIYVLVDYDGYREFSTREAAEAARRRCEGEQPRMSPVAGGQELQSVPSNLKTMEKS